MSAVRHPVQNEPLAQHDATQQGGSTPSAEDLKCPECGNPVHPDDVRCPTCKATREVFNGHDGLGGLFIILGLLIGACGIACVVQERLRVLGIVALATALVSALFGRKLLLKWRIYRW